MSAHVDTDDQRRQLTRDAARDRRQAALVRDLDNLLKARPELAEACPLAELTVRAVRWTV